ncbi:MAG: hypothetical protein JW934_16385, partial [Anaerolineae bacterium]|nr:hypothetical protein [Anaerolineae bacterium]
MSENRSIPRRADPRSTSPRQWPVDDLEIALSSTFPDRRWLPVLEAAAHTSVADTAQIQADTGLSRDQVNAVLNHFDTLTGGNILTRIALSVPRPGVRGRASNLYALGDLGAALLRAHGHPNAHPCGFADDARQLSHARAMIDVRLAAQAAGLDVVTDRLLPYEDDRVLRPDNLVTLPNGTRAMFEIEQEANLSVLRRVTDSVRNKAAFYRSADVGSTSRTIRVLINLTLGPAWDKMLQVWERATAIVADECGGDLPFQLLAMPLHVFLDQPDWGESPEVARWTSLFDPAQTVAFGPDEPPANQVAQRPGKRSRCSTQDRSVPQLPAKVVRRTPVDDQLILRAYYQHLCETGPELAYTADVARPHPAFFQTMQVVYAASHPENPTPMQEAAYPYASLYLLQRYFDLHPRLRQALSLT